MRVSQSNGKRILPPEYLNPYYKDPQNGTPNYERPQAGEFFQLNSFHIIVHRPFHSILHCWGFMSLYKPYVVLLEPHIFLFYFRVGLKLSCQNHANRRRATALGYTNGQNDCP